MVEEDVQVSPENRGLDEYRMLNPVAKNAMYFANAIKILIMAAIYIGIFEGLRKVGELPSWLFYVITPVFAAIIIYWLIAPGIFYRHYRYRMDEDCIEVRKGVIFHSHSLVPVERIHQVQVSKGPILRKFGLADVTMTTAGGTADMQYLDDEIAEYIAEHLNQKIIQMLKARE